MFKPRIAGKACKLRSVSVIYVAADLCKAENDGFIGEMLTHFAQIAVPRFEHGKFLEAQWPIPE